MVLTTCETQVIEKHKIQISVEKGKEVQSATKLQFSITLYVVFVECDAWLVGWHLVELFTYLLLLLF
jgi:hypothetical protein